MRLAFVISSLELGGAQKALTGLARGLARRGHEVHVLSFDAPGAQPFFPLDEQVRLQPLDLNRPARHALHGLFLNLRRLAVLRRALKTLRPDAVAGFMDTTNVLCLLASLGLDIPVLACERTDPRRHRIGPFWHALRRLAYPLAARVVAQTEAAAEALPGRVLVLPNGVEEVRFSGGDAPPQTPASGVVAPGGDRPSPRPGQQGGGHGLAELASEAAGGRAAGDGAHAHAAAGGVEKASAANGAAEKSATAEDGAAGGLVLGLGRLAREKGFDLLLEAFAQAGQGREGWRLAMVGEGPERGALEKQRRELGLDGRADLPGAVADVAPWLRRAELFVLASRYEGFPNALCEALAAGVACVAFDCGGIPGEIVRGGVDGLLVPPGEVDALASALARLMDDAQLRGRLAARAPEVLLRFGQKQALDRWEALLREVAAQGSGS